MRWMAIVLLVLAACSSQPVMEDSSASEMMEDNSMMEAGDMVDISSAMKLGTPVKCVMTAEGQTSTMYMKGSRMRMDTSPADAHAIYTEDTMYAWQGSQGTMMKLSDIKQMASGSQYSAKTPEQVVDEAKAVDTKCEHASVGEDMFTPPGDVEFQDLGEMMRQLQALPQN